MSLSWRLYRVLNIFSGHPITRYAAYWHAQRRMPSGLVYEPGPWFNSVITMVLITSSCGAMMAIINHAPTLFMTPLICLGPFSILVLFPLLWVPAFSYSLVARIIRERTQGTWDLMRLTPLDDETLHLIQFRRVCASNMMLLVYLRIALVLAGAMTGLGFVDIVLFSPEVWNVGLGGYVLNPSIPEQLILPLVLVLGMVGLVLFLVDRVQQFLYMLVVGLAAGTWLKMRPHLAALFGAVSAGGAWLAEAIGALFLMQLLVTDPDTLILGFWVIMLAGPVPGFMLLALSPWRMVVAVCVVFAAREIALRVCWGWMLHTEQQA